MRLALTEIRRARLRFGLLTGAVALITMLILFLSAISVALIGSLTGAIKGMDADVLVYSDNARGNLQGSRLAPDLVERVARVPGVSEAGAVALTMATAGLPTGSGDLQVIGISVGGPGWPSGLTSGRLPASPDETAVDYPGATLDSELAVGADGRALRVVGLLRGAQFAATATAYVTMGTFDQLARAANTRAPFVPINAVAVMVAPDVAAPDVAARIGRDVPGTAGYTIDAAVAAIPGLESVSQTFLLLVGLAFVVGVVIVGFFFLILTVQKLKVFTLLRAVGATNSQLAGAVAAQVVVVVLAAALVAVGLTLVALAGIDTGIPVSLSPAVTGATVTAILVASLVASLISIRRIRSIDPAEATGAR